MNLELWNSFYVLHLDDGVNVHWMQGVMKLRSCTRIDKFADGDENQWSMHAAGSLLPVAVDWVWRFLSSSSSSLQLRTEILGFPLYIVVLSQLLAEGLQREGSCRGRFHHYLSSISPRLQLRGSGTVSSHIVVSATATWSASHKLIWFLNPNTKLGCSFLVKNLVSFSLGTEIDQPHHHGCGAFLWTDRNQFVGFGSFRHRAHILRQRSHPCVGARCASHRQHQCGLGWDSGSSYLQGGPAWLVVDRRESKNPLPGVEFPKC